MDGPRVSGRITVSGRVSGTLTLRSTTSASGRLGGRNVGYARGSGASATAVDGDAGAFPAIPRALLDPDAARRAARAR